jgi:hypothetical protein
MQKEEQLESEQETLQNTSRFIQQTSTVTKESDINEDFYKIRAIQDDGLTVEIVGVTSNLSYQPNLAINTERGRVNTFSGEETDNIDSEYFTQYDNMTVFHFSTEILIDVTIYYKTVYDQIYKITFKQTREHYRENRYRSSVLPLLNQLLKRISLSDRVDSVSDVSSLNSIDASIHPDETLTDGEIKIGDEKAPLRECEEVEVSKSGCDNVDKHIRFITGKNYEKHIRNDDELLNDWIWGYISDVRGNSDDDTVVLTVQTPLGTTVFPCTLLCDTDTPFWRLVDEMGRNLTSLRGEDVCIRRRGRYNKVYDMRDIRNARFSGHDYPRFDRVTTKQPVPSPNRLDNPLLIDEPNDVEPVVVSSDYAWVLGIPPTDRFSDEDLRENRFGGTETEQNQENHSQGDKGTKSILGRVFESFL